MKDDLSFKIITIGDSGVGKTSIIRRFIYNIFDEANISSIGIIFSFKDVTLKNRKTVKLKLIDTAGQEKYRSLSKSYFRNADGVLFVFALNDLNSLENLTDWINLFKENNNKEGILKYLIGNKDDLDHRVRKELIDEFLKKNKIEFEYRSLSALKDNNRIDKLFEEMAEKLFYNYKNLEQKPIQLEKKNFEKKRKKCISCIEINDDR